MNVEFFIGGGGLGFGFVETNWRASVQIAKFFELCVKFGHEFFNRLGKVGLPFFIALNNEVKRRKTVEVARQRVGKEVPRLAA